MKRDRPVVIDLAGDDGAENTRLLLQTLGKAVSSAGGDVEANVAGDCR